ncbi:MAG TPA: tripartite tricarboxylate transporter substrate binding protein [Burkholderiales bacterium]|nr:tripartite tricarboxylate transporter substrate binding protein [Burkholderiales bacterium]
MKLKTLVVLLAALAAAANAAEPAYPSRPVRVIAPSSPGSGIDFVGRTVSQGLSESIGQQFVVDNRAGAGGNIAAEVTAKAAPDGYTLFLATSTHVINVSLYRKLSYDILKEFAPVSRLTNGFYVIVVHPSVPAKNVKELIALAKARPGQLNFASAGNGNATHLAGELFKSIAQVDIVHVPYKGTGPALVDLVGGQVQIMFSNFTAALPHIKSGKLRAIAVSGEQRTPSAPDIPTVIESGLKGYTVTSWYGLVAPAHTPQPIIAKLNSEIAKVLKQPGIRDRLANDGAEPSSNTPAEFAALIRTELAKWEKVIKSAGLYHSL